jgi:hypothetical protein
MATPLTFMNRQGLTLMYTRTLLAIAISLALPACQENPEPNQASASRGQSPGSPASTPEKTNKLVLSCDNAYDIKAVYHSPDADGILSKLSLEITKDGKTEKLEMVPAIAASGAKFETEDQSQSFWEHQDEFTLTKGDTDLSVCQEPVKEREFTTRSGKSFIVREDNTEAASLSKITVSTKGFSDGDKTIELGEKDPIVDIFLADLDQDGFEELYIATKSAGSGSYENLYGYASNHDQNITEISLPEISDQDDKPGGHYEGYMGGDNFYVEKNILIREFPIYLESDNNAEPTGKTKRVYYTLTPNDKTWLLVATKSEQVE